MSSCRPARSAAAPSRSCAAPSRRIDESPIRSPAAFLPRPRSLSRSPICASRSFADVLRGSSMGQVHKKRQSRRTRRFIGFGSTSIWPLRPRSQEKRRCEKAARCVLPPRQRKGRVPLRAPVAKKVRTPPPPRRVQAPQRRETRRAAGVSTRPPWFYAAAGAAAVALTAAIVIGVLVLRDDGGGSAKTNTTAANYKDLPGIRKTKAPWPPEYEFVADRLLPLGLNTLPQEAANTHYHAHLDIFVDGRKVAVPQAIGINQGAGYI